MNPVKHQTEIHFPCFWMSIDLHPMLMSSASLTLWRDGASSLIIQVPLTISSRCTLSTTISVRPHMLTSVDVLSIFVASMVPVDQVH